MPMRGALALATHQHHLGARCVHPNGSEKVGQSVCFDAFPLGALEVARQRKQRATSFDGIGLGQQRQGLGARMVARE